MPNQSASVFQRGVNPVPLTTVHAVLFSHDLTDPGLVELCKLWVLACLPATSLSMSAGMMKQWWINLNRWNIYGSCNALHPMRSLWLASQFRLTNVASLWDHQTLGMFHDVLNDTHLMQGYRKNVLSQRQRCLTMLLSANQITRMSHMNSHVVPENDTQCWHDRHDAPGSY